MQDLLDVLIEYGWHLLDGREHPRASPDAFRLEYEKVRWAIIRGCGPAVIEIEFVAFGHLGQRTDALNDICYCKMVGTDDTLYFDKRKDPAWRENVTRFVHSLNRRAEDDRG